MKKYLIMFCLAGAVALAPVNSANARYHHGTALVAAAVGGAVAGLVGAVVESSIHSGRVYVEYPAYTYPAYTYIEPVPFVVHERVVMHEPHHYYRPVHHVRHHYRHHR